MVNNNGSLWEVTTKNIVKGKLSVFKIHKCSNSLIDPTIPVQDFCLAVAAVVVVVLLVVV